MRKFSTYDKHCHIVYIQQNESYEELRVLAQHALEAKLYVNNWNLQKALQAILTHKEKQEMKISLAFKDGKEVGICLMHQFGKEVTVQFFVKKKFRRTGIGTILYASFPMDSKHYACKGIKGCEDFYKRISIAMFDEQLAQVVTSSLLMSKP